jgi:hypothetical protein
VTYAKRPFGGLRQVLSYLANYTYRVALSNRRIIAVDEARQIITLSYRDYRDRSKVKLLFLSVRESIRRFSLHILPAGLVRIRHYGILGNSRRKANLAAAGAIFARRGHAVTVEQAASAHESPRCPACGQSGLRLIAFTEPDGTYHLLRHVPPTAIAHEPSASHRSHAVHFEMDFYPPLQIVVTTLSRHDKTALLFFPGSARVPVALPRRNS